MSELFYPEHRLAESLSSFEDSLSEVNRPKRLVKEVTSFITPNEVLEIHEVIEYDINGRESYKKSHNNEIWYRYNDKGLIEYEKWSSHDYASETVIEYDETGLNPLKKTITTSDYSLVTIYEYEDVQPQVEQFALFNK